MFTDVDTVDPTIACPPDQTAQTTGGLDVQVSWPAPTVSDDNPGVTYVCYPASNDPFSVGVHTVTCTATDAGGNSAECMFTVTVEGNVLFFV